MTRYANPVMDQLAIKERPDHLSFHQVSKLSSLYPLSCPRQWAYRTLMGLPDRKSNALWYGSALDTGATAYQNARRAGRHDDEACRRIGLGATQGSLQVSALPPELDRQFVVDAALVLFTWLAENTEPPLDVQTEHEFTCWGSDGQIIKVIGRSDWIDSDEAVVDLKWSGSPRWKGTPPVWDENWLRSVRDQVTFYHMARLAVNQRAGAMPAIAGRGRVVVTTAAANRKTPVVKSTDFVITSADIDRCIGAIVEADDIARSDRHPARPGEACKFCRYVDRCQADNARLAPSDEELAG